MNIRYNPTEKDYINVKLLAVSQNSNSMKILNIEKYLIYIMSTIVLLFNVFILIFGENTFNILNIVTFFILLIVLLFTCKFITWLCTWNLKKTYKKLKYKDTQTDITLDQASLILSDEKETRSFKTSDILRFIEVQEYFFIQVNYELYLSIPKDQIPNIDAVRTELKMLANEYNIPYVVKLDWVNDFFNKKSKI